MIQIQKMIDTILLIVHFITQFSIAHAVESGILTTATGKIASTFNVETRIILHDSSSNLFIPIASVSQSIPLPKQGPVSGWIGSSHTKSDPVDDLDLLLPDLQTMPPSDLIIQTNPSTGQKVLRLSNSVINKGPGALELRGVIDIKTGKAIVNQQIYARDGNIVDKAVDEFIFHPEHDHWHFNNFARYELWSLATDWSLDKLVSLSDKVTFCLRDIAQSNHPDRVERRAYTRCGQELQGISSGWIDIYHYYFDGQSVDITDIPNGVYILRSITDPDNQLWEIDDSNNQASIYIEIKCDDVHIIGDFSELNAIDKYRRLD